MNYLRILNIPVLAGLLVALAACPKDGDQTTVAVNDDPDTPSTTIVETETQPPADTNVDVDITTSAADEPVVVVSEDVRTKYPEVVTVVERTVATPAVTDNTVFIADSPAVKVWTTEVVPATAPADVVYRVRDFNVTNATDTVVTAEGYVLVASPSPDFTSERKYVTYTFQKDPATSQWLINDLVVTRTEPATEADLTIFTNTSSAGGTDSTTDGSGDMTGGAGDTSGDSGSGSGDTGGGTSGDTGAGGGM